MVLKLPSTLLDLKEVHCHYLREVLVFSLWAPAQFHLVSYGQQSKAHSFLLPFSFISLKLHLQVEEDAQQNEQSLLI